MAKGRTMRMNTGPTNLIEAMELQREAAMASEVVLPEGAKGDDVFYVARPRGRHVPRRRHVVDQDGHGKTVVEDYYFTAFYGPFEGKEAVEAWLRHKRSRGTVDFVDAIRVVTEPEARKIRRAEEGDDLTGA